LLKLVPHNSSVTAATFLVETPLDGHLHQRQHQRLLVSLIAVEDSRAEAPVAILRDEQLQASDSGGELPGFVAISVPSASFGTFVRGGLQVFGHFGFQELLQGGADDLAQEGVVVDQRFTQALWKWRILELSHRSLRSKWGS
jgi:hypothetical protein